MNHMRFAKPTTISLIGLILLLILVQPTLAAFLTFVEVQKDGFGSIDGLDGPQAVAISPDGKHAYVASSLDNAVAVFKRDPVSGALTFVEAQKEGLDRVTGLSGAVAVAIAPDGRHVYAAGYLDKALAVFKRDDTTGKLSFIEAQRDGVNGVVRLDGPQAVIVSPDGRHVYATGVNDDAVVLFNRDIGSGRLAFVEARRNGLDGVTGLDGASLAAISADGHHLYVTSIHDKAVVAFSREADSGRLTFMSISRHGAEELNALDHPTALTLSPDGRQLYVASSTDNAITIFSRNRSTGVLTLSAVHQANLAGPQDLAISPDGRQLFAASRADDALVVFNRDVKSGALTFVIRHQDGLDQVNGLDGVNAVAISPDGRHLYLTGYSDDSLAAFQRKRKTGEVNFIQVQQDGDGGIDGLAGVFSVAVSPDGRHLYTAGGIDNAVAIFKRDRLTGALTFVEALKDGLNGMDGLAGAISVTLSPDGRHLYVAGAVDNAVTLFSRNPTTGRLTFVELYRDGIEGVDGLFLAMSLAVTPDGRYLYAAGMNDDAVAVFRRDPGSGRLGFVEAVRDGVDGVTGLDGAIAVAASPDGKHLYVASIFDDALTVFSQSATTGALTLVEILKDGKAGLDGLNRVQSVAVSPDGRQLYAIGSAEGVVATFRRDPDSGRLTLIDLERRGNEGVHGLDGASSVTVSPDGRQVYVTGIKDNAVVVFDRDPAAGTLTYVECHHDGMSGVDGLDGAVSVTVSPDGRHIYAAGLNDAAIAVLAAPGSGAEQMVLGK